MTNPGSLPQGYRHLLPEEIIKWGDHVWSSKRRRFLHILRKNVGKKVGTISTLIRKGKKNGSR